jgi:predicted dehydrogenase
MKYKVAVIGAGYFGQKHIKLLSQMPDVEITGIVDTDVDKAIEIAKQYGLKYHTDFKDLFKVADVFFVVTPTITHFEIAIELIKEGKDLFIEKPLTEKPAFAEKILDEAIKRNLIIQAGLIERYNPVVISLMEHLREPIFINAERVSPFLGRATDTDVTYDLMIHDIDLIWFMLKNGKKLKVKDLKVYKKSFVTERIDHAVVWFDFINNDAEIKASVTASRISADFRRNLTIIQNQNVLHADLINKSLKMIDRQGKSTELSVKNKDSQPLYEEIRDFLNSVKNRRLSPHAPSPEDLIEVIEIIDRINGGT